MNLVCYYCGTSLHDKGETTRHDISWCNKCDKKGWREADKTDKKIINELKEKGLCCWPLSGRDGYCEEKTDNIFCEEHTQKCSVCGKPATHGCDMATWVICGMPLCDKCGCPKH